MASIFADVCEPDSVMPWLSASATYRRSNSFAREANSPRSSWIVPARRRLKSALSLAGLSLRMLCFGWEVLVALAI